MKKKLVTAENVNSIIKYYKNQIDVITKELAERNAFNLSAIFGGLKVLEYNYKKELESLTVRNNELREEVERLKKLNEK